MGWLVKRKFALLALAMAMTLPSALYARGFLNWWRSPPPPPILDVDFDSVSTISAALTKLTIEQRRITDSSKTQFSDVQIAAQVASETLTFDQIVLVEGAWTVTIDIDPAPLTTHKFGSRFRADASISIDDGSDTTDVDGKVFGRISERNDTYYLSAAVVATLLSNEGNGNGCLEILRVPLAGNTDVPIVP